MPNTNFFENIAFERNVTPQVGKVLVAEPFLMEPIFKRSVVYMVNHDNTGSLGFVLNKPSNATLIDVFPNLGLKSPIYFGGPVEQESLFFLHNYGGIIEGAMPIANNIYWGGNFNSLQKLVDSGIFDAKRVKFFSGYSGWSKEQLNDELSQQSWVVSNLESAQVLANQNKNLWKQVMQNMGKKFAVMANFPEDPSLN